MPYVTGTATSATDLRNAIVSAATANGWTWDGANNMLYKGAIYGRLTVGGLNVWVQAALGYTGGTLTTPAPVAVGITDRLTGEGNTPLSYPVTYHIFIHTAPDDIIVAVNYQTHWWQWLALGQAVNLGVPGSVVWQWGTAAANADSWSSIVIHADGNYSTSLSYSNSMTSAAPFWATYLWAGMRHSAIHLDIFGRGWWPNQHDGYASGASVMAIVNHTVGPLLATQPNRWNGEANLIRMHITAKQPSDLWAFVAELPHLRMTRNDNLTDCQIMTIGPDRWFIAPAYRKNTVSRDGTTDSSYNHSGTIAIAVRYDGP